MWAQYKRTFIPVQLFTIAVCLVFYFLGHATRADLVCPIIVMEVGAIYGAKWAWRIKGGKVIRKPRTKPMLAPLT